ncbi:unnamed protein product [Effrenium voratum]|nr:unnamed protein product [Effrenium voratum]
MGCGEVLRLRGLPWSAGPSEVAQFLHEYGIKDKDVTMCVTESGRQDGHAWVVFQQREVAKKALQEKQRQSLGGRFIELFQWRDHSKEKVQGTTTTKIYSGVLKHFDAQRKCGYIFSPDAEVDVGKTDIYAFKDVLERGRAAVGDTLAFPLHWSPKGQPQASSPLIRIAAKKSFAHTGTFKLVPADAKQAGFIECPEVTQVFGRSVYVCPSMAATLSPGSLVAFNCHLASVPAAFAVPPLESPGPMPVCSRAQQVDSSFQVPGPQLHETQSAEGFDARAPEVGFENQEICRFFTNTGWCKYGETCKHSHVLAAQAPVRGPEVCVFFQRSGWCRFGDACRNAHVMGGPGPFGMGAPGMAALQKRLDSAMKHLAEVRRGSTDRQYAKARKPLRLRVEPRARYPLAAARSPPILGLPARAALVATLCFQAPSLVASPLRRGERQARLARASRPKRKEAPWCSVVINLARRPDRRLQLAQVLAQQNGEVLQRLLRVDAVDGQKIDLSDEKATDKLLAYITPAALETAQEAKRIGAHTIVHKDGELVKFHDHLTEGGIACAMSHYKALKTIAEHPTAEWGLILEDDIQTLVPNVDAVIARIIETLPPNWDALFLGYHGGVLRGTGPGGKDTEQEHARAQFELQIDEMRGMRDFEGSVEDDVNEVPVLRMYSPLYGLYAWVVRKKAAVRLLEEAFPVPGQVDHALSHWLVQRGRSFKVAPRHMLFYSPKSEVAMDSDIQTMAHLDALLEDPQQCERYMDFINSHKSAETGAMAQSITQAEAKVEASKEAFQALIDLPEDADPLEMQTVLQKAAAAQSEATAAIQAARVPLMERLQKAKADGVTTDTSEVLKEFQEMFTKLAQLQSKLDEQRREANDKEHKFVAACLTQEATEMFSNLDKTLENLNAAAAPLIAKGEELQPLLRLGQLLEVLRKHASAASKTPGALWAELAKASGGELLMPKGIIGALKELRPEPDLTDLFGTTEEDERVLLAAAARMDEEATKQEDGGISEEKFLDHMKVRYLCVAVVTMTTEKEVNTKTVRKLEVSEVLEAMSEATREPQSGLLRVECKALQDGAQGFVTVAGSGGTTYLEVYTPFMACVRAAEAALAESHEAVTSTASYLKQKHDELRSTRGTAALTDLKQKLQDLRVRATRAQVAHSDVKQKVTEAKNRYDRQLEAHKKWRQTAAEKLAADTITGEASNMVDELIAKATTACAAASSILSVTSDSASSSSLQALEQVEKDLLAVVEACAEGEGKIMKTVMEEIRNASKGPLFDARRMMFRLKVKLAPLPSNCKKHLKTIQEKKTEMMEDVRRSVGDQLREHALKSQLSADALFDQLRKVSGEAGDEVEDGAISVSSLRSCLGDKDMSSVSALQGFEAGVTRSAFLDLVEEYRKCVKEVALTPALQVKGTPTRKIEVDEVVQVLGQPSTDEPGGLVRAPCRALRDNSEGWITMKGNQGTVFLERVRKPYFLCTAETPFLESCASSSKQIGKVSPDELLEVLEGPRLEKTAEVTRARGKATKDGKVGWVLFKDDSGRCFFELQELLLCKGSVALTDNFDIGACKAIRKLEVGETLTALEDAPARREPKHDPHEGQSFVRWQGRLGHLAREPRNHVRHRN